MDTFTCKCGEVVNLDDIYRDSYYDETTCEICFNKKFAEERDKGNTKWFLANYDEEDLRNNYKKSFLKKIGLIK